MRTLLHSSLALQYEVLGLFAQYVRADLLILSFLLGYFILLISCFTRKKRSEAYAYWNQLDWGERFLIGFMLGFLLLIFSSSGPIALLSFLSAERVFLLDKIDPLLIWLLMFILILILSASARSVAREPLYSSKWREIVRRFLGERIARLLLVWGPLALLFFIVVQAISSYFFYATNGVALSTYTSASQELSSPFLC